MLILLGLIWGSSFILIKKGLRVLTPLELASIRVVSGGFFLAPFAWVYWKELDKKLLPKLFLCGCIGTLIPGILFAFAGQKLNSAASGSLNALTPVFTLLIGVLIYSRKLHPVQVIGITIGFLGAILLASRNYGFSALFDLNSYALLVVVATILYGVNIHLTKHWFAHLDPKFVSSFTITQIAILALLYLLCQTHFYSVIAQGDKIILESLGSVILLGLLSTGFASILFMRLIKHTSAVFSSSVTYLIPVFAIAWGLWDGEPFTANLLFGVLAVFIGIILVNRSA
jgi:drug/metabolite transporter (DMT)-like permease